MLFILELGAIINYLGVREPRTPSITFIPGATLCAERAHSSRFISVLLNLLMITDISGGFSNMIKAAALHPDPPQ